jgi:nucleotide-binding universal stress UspA family protein
MREIFTRVVCGVDPSEAGEVAAKLAARVTEPSGELALVTVDDPSVAVHAGWLMSKVMEQLAIEAEQAIERGSSVATRTHQVETRLFEGNPLDCLLGEIRRRKATLAVVGTHGHSRAVGIALGSVATHLLHEAPCSVLVARPPGDEWWPRTIVVGIDGSPASAEGAAAARRLAERFGSTLRFVAAMSEPSVDREAAHELAPDLDERPGRAVDELHELSQDADLVVVGSRSLKGIRALGSVSERIAHEALSSVLVVRGETEGEKRTTTEEAK